MPEHHAWHCIPGSTAARETRWDLGHDAAHQLVSATLKQTSNNAVQADQRWGFDSIGNRTLEHDLQTGVRTEYSHNSTNQLVDKKTYSSGQEPWVKGSLDEPGSVSVGGNVIAVKGDNSFEGQSPTRTSTITAKDTAGNTTTESWQLNSGSGSTPDSTHSYTHDSEGNLLGDGTSTFEWDLRNRLTAIVTGTHRTEFAYDGSDRRVRVVEKESGTVTSDKRYVFNGLALLEERASNNSTVLRRFYGSGHVDVADSGKRYAYTTDHLGSIREVMLLDGTSGNPTTATLAARYDYDLWGKRTVLDGGSAAETLVMHGYTGHVRHAWSGLWLAPYRGYSSALGRWISRDPLAENGGINLYEYVGNDPLCLIDPLGLEGFEVWSHLDFMYRNAYKAYNEQRGNPVSEEGYVDAMNQVSRYQQQNGVVSEIYAFGGFESKIGRGSPAVPDFELIGTFGIDAATGETHGGIIPVIDIGHHTYFGPDFTNEGTVPILIKDLADFGPKIGSDKFGEDVSKYFAGAWTTGHESGAYFGWNIPAPTGNFFAGVGAGFHTSRLSNLFKWDYWAGRLPTNKDNCGSK